MIIGAASVSDNRGDGVSDNWGKQGITGALVTHATPDPALSSLKHSITLL